MYLFKERSKLFFGSFECKINISLKYYVNKINSVILTESKYNKQFYNNLEIFYFIQKIHKYVSRLNLQAKCALFSYIDFT